MYELAICAIFRDESPYLAEWVEVHRAAGVEHFFLYDNGSADDSLDVLGRVTDGDITVVPWPGEVAQLLAYADALYRFRTAATWLAFIDVDEFLFSPTGQRLPEILGAFRAAAPAVVANWCVYGTGGVETRPESVVRAFRYRTTGDLNRHVKSIVQPRFTLPEKPADPHHFAYYQDRHAVNERGVRVPGPFCSPSFELLRVNHYHSKSVEEAKAKAKKRRADNGEMRALEALLDPALNEVYDPTLIEVLGWE